MTPLLFIRYDVYDSIIVTPLLFRAGWLLRITIIIIVRSYDVQLNTACSYSGESNAMNNAFTKIRSRRVCARM